MLIGSQNTQGNNAGSQVKGKKKVKKGKKAAQGQAALKKKKAQAQKPAGFENRDKVSLSGQAQGGAESQGNSMVQGLQSSFGTAA